jgi:hypothetical protein
MAQLFLSSVLFQGAVRVSAFAGSVEENHRIFAPEYRIMGFNGIEIRTYQNVSLWENM